MHQQGRSRFHISIKTLLLVAALASAMFAGYRQGWLHINSPGLAGNAQMQGEDEARLQAQFRDILASYRKTIVLLAHDSALTPGEHDAANQAGQALFHDNLARTEDATHNLEQLFNSGAARRFEVFGILLDYVESGEGLYDADRLAFRELLQSMHAIVAKDSSLTSIKLHKRIGEDLEALDEIEHLYEKEIGQVFGRFEQRAIELKREHWDDYVAHLEKLYSRDQILRENGVILPYAAPKKGTVEDAIARKPELSGLELPPKTVALTFDDGPHPLYTAEIETILKQYGLPATFFNVGRNLGNITREGKAELSPRSEISRKLLQDGFVLGNHSYTHAKLSDESGKELRAEIINTDLLLKALDSNRSPLFRFPYGAGNSEAATILQEVHLKSVMWNIDSLDWADPVPKSIADRVLQQVHHEGRGIILFHDTHERTIKALPAVLDQLVAEGYQFAGWDGSLFRATKPAQGVPEKAQIAGGYNKSWAIVIGVDDYLKWPKLHHAVNDANAVRQTLVEKLGFQSDHVFTLTNQDATRNGILSVFHTGLLHGGIKRDDRVFVFFAGHGATRKLSSGRDLGYLIPYDSDPADYATDAIPMTEIQNIAESLPAKHIFFVTDACYSGLGLARGAGSNYIKDNSRRIGRQMLTAGGTDQMVADSGPNGHSIFTWTLLQGLAGKGDLNGDGLITATELAAYVAPAVASVSQQTPAFGSMPGSQGGEFIFELPGENEFLNEQSAQLPGDAIALNNKLDSALPAAPANAPEAAAPVVVKDLQGEARKITPPPPVLISTKQMAQRAHDRALQLYKEKNYAAAETELAEALKLRPDFTLAANNLGFVYYKEGKYKEARLWFEKTIKMDPSRAIAYVNLGDACVQLHDADNAKKSFQAYLALVPTGGRATYARQQLDKL
jgi:peptidoglycan/xylan/chitin deacetylase (PgdA/CDA1 family)/uncharacterized caspase-like protein